MLTYSKSNLNVDMLECDVGEIWSGGEWVLKKLYLRLLFVGLKEEEIVMRRFKHS